MPIIKPVLGDITSQEVDAIVNAANNAMRGGGGVDGAIHRGGGPAVLRDCIERFPDGLATGDAGWTTAGDLNARWVIHTVGPDCNAGQCDRSVLESCYRRALEVADELGARSVAFPLISAGIYGWPMGDAIAAAIGTIVATDSRVDEVRMVVLDPGIHRAIERHLESSTPIRIFQGIQNLHQRGYHRVRAWPGIGGAGYLRILVASVDNMTTNEEDFIVVREHDSAIWYSDGGLTEFAGGQVSVATSPAAVGDLILNALPGMAPTADDPAYVAWFADLVELVERAGEPPIAYEEGIVDRRGWAVGSDEDGWHPHPPAPPQHVSDASLRPDIG